MVQVTLSIPSFRGFSLFHDCSEIRENSIQKDFQSPVLGAFLCFRVVVVVESEHVVDFQSPVLGAFLCFVALRCRELDERAHFQSPVLGAFLCFGIELECCTDPSCLLSIPSFRGFSLFPISKFLNSRIFNNFWPFLNGQFCKPQTAPEYLKGFRYNPRNVATFYSCLGLATGNPVHFTYVQSVSTAQARM